jgi:drug/metabolite transporter (DMT)-like permease
LQSEQTYDSRRTHTPERKAPSFSVLPYLAILGAVLLWGGSFSAMKIAVGALNPWSVMGVRMLMACMVAACLAPKLGPLPRKPADWRFIAPMIALQPCLYFVLESHALQYTTSSQAGIIAAFVPLMVAVGAAVFLGEKLRANTLAGLALSIIGVGWLSLSGDSSEHASNPLLGNMLELSAMACAAGYMVLLKRLTSTHKPLTLTALQMAGGLVFFSPGLWMLWKQGLASLDWTVWLALIYLGAVVTLGAFGLYNYGISRMEAGKASIGVNLVPVAAAALGWIILGETLNATQIMASTLVLGGVWWSQRGGRG